MVGGSSPRVRGKPVLHRVIQGHRGLIPACAGKTGQRSVPRLITGAHPRVCGENRASWKRRRRCSGSSPRVRGKLDAWNDTAEDGGLIPACAGKTHRRSRRTRSSWAHPRVCGENESTPATSPIPDGSSPRVRGKRARSARPGSTGRLIPACAGKTWSPRARSASTTAHPRVCGENV